MSSGSVLQKWIAVHTWPCQIMTLALTCLKQYTLHNIHIIVIISWYKHSIGLAHRPIKLWLFDLTLILHANLPMLIIISISLTCSIWNIDGLTSLKIRWQGCPKLMNWSWGYNSLRLLYLHFHWLNYNVGRTCIFCVFVINLWSCFLVHLIMTVSFQLYFQFSYS